MRPFISKLYLQRRILGAALRLALSSHRSLFAGKGGSPVVVLSVKVPKIQHHSFLSFIFVRLLRFIQVPGLGKGEYRMEKRH